MYRLRHICLLRQKIWKDITFTFHDDDNDNKDDEENKHIQTLRHNISASKTYREKIKTFIIYFWRKLLIKSI